MKKIVLFASGSGTNVQNIAEFFADSESVVIAKIYTNNPGAFVIERANNLGIPVCIFNKEQFLKNDFILQSLKNDCPDLIVLAGFLWLIPVKIISEFHGKIINIHPALLPKYGGKGMYGHHVHESVILNRETLSGITIHFVNENYDDGAIVFQATCEIDANDNADDLAAKIHQLEFKHFPTVIKTVLENLK